MYVCVWVCTSVLYVPVFVCVVCAAVAASRSRGSSQVYTVQVVHHGALWSGGSSQVYTVQVVHHGALWSGLRVCDYLQLVLSVPEHHCVDMIRVQ